MKMPKRNIQTVKLWYEFIFTIVQHNSRHYGGCWSNYVKSGVLIQQRYTNRSVVV